MKILFFTHYFRPEGNAPAVRVYEMCRRWVAAGHEVTVITGVPNVPAGKPYDGYRNRLYQRETIEGIDVRRVWTYLAANKGTIRRILNYLSYTWSAVWAGLFLKRPTVVIATSPQFFCGWAGAIVSKLRRLPFILEIRDLWPESIEAVGAINSGFAIRQLEKSERSLYKAADRIVTVGDGYKDRLILRDVPADKITVVPNGVDVDLFARGERNSDFLEQVGASDRFVCSYVGTIGMACGLDTALQAGKLLRERGRTDILFLLVGDGALRESLEREAVDCGLENVVFAGRIGRDEIPGVLSSSDACLVHLRKRDLFKTVLPSKVFEAAAASKPIILGVEGAAAELVSGAGAGVCIEPENAEELANAVCRLADDRAAAAAMGVAGNESICTRYNYGTLAEEYIRFIITMVQTS